MQVLSVKLGYLKYYLKKCFQTFLQQTGPFYFEKFVIALKCIKIRKLKILTIFNDVLSNNSYSFNKKTLHCYLRTFYLKNIKMNCCVNF